MGKFGKSLEDHAAAARDVGRPGGAERAIRRNASEPDNSALGGEAHFFPWKHGRVFYKTAGLDNAGPPLVFIHGIGAGASSFMWRKNFDELARDFPVYALDLLGFGLL